MRKILIIDDERPTLAMFRLFLHVYGFEVVTAENGEEGLELFEREQPNIVLTDIKMPGMDGIEVLGRIKKAKPDTEVIVITGHGDMELAITALNLDATDFISKPIQKADLDAALKRAEERLKLAREKAQEVTVSIQGEEGVVSVRGNVTSASEAALSQTYEMLKAQGARRLVFAFEENVSVNGAGIAVLRQLLSRCREEGLHTAIAGLSDNFKNIFHIVGITKLAEIESDIEAAMRSLRQADRNGR